jgi:hypothetical protein
MAPCTSVFAVIYVYEESYKPTKDAPDEADALSSSPMLPTYISLPVSTLMSPATSSSYAGLVVPIPMFPSSLMTVDDACDEYIYPLASLHSPDTPSSTSDSARSNTLIDDVID